MDISPVNNKSVWSAYLPQGGLQEVRQKVADYVSCQWQELSISSITKNKWTYVAIGGLCLAVALYTIHRLRSGATQPTSQPAAPENGALNGAKQTSGHDPQEFQQLKNLTLAVEEKNKELTEQRADVERKEAALDALQTQVKELLASNEAAQLAKQEEQRLTQLLQQQEDELQRLRNPMGAAAADENVATLRSFAKSLLVIIGQLRAVTNKKKMIPTDAHALADSLDSLYGFISNYGVHSSDVV